MLEKVKLYAMEKYAGDESAADEFVKGFAKQAMASRSEHAVDREGRSGGIGSISKNTMAGAMKSGISEALGKGLGGLLISGGIAAGAHALNQVNRNNLHTRYLQSLEQAIAQNRLLREEDREKVKRYADTIFKFAPNVSADVNLLTSILTNAIQGESIDPMTIKTLTELENRYTSNTGVIGSIKSFV